MLVESLKAETNQDRFIAKIGLIGTSCVGKTAVIKDLQATYAGVPEVAIVEGQARDFFVANPEIVDRFSAETQGKIMHLSLSAEEAEVAKSPLVVVSDRAPICAPVYVAATGDYDGAERLYEEITNQIPTYRFLLLTPHNVPFRTDEQRTEDNATRQRIHQEYINFMLEHGIDYEVVGGTLDQRITRVQTEIESFLP